MTGKERMLAAMLGEAVDRPPIWLREGFDFLQPIPGADHFSQGWKADPEYVELLEFAREHCDMRVGWSAGGHFNRTLAIPPHVMKRETETVDADTRRARTIIETPKGRLTSVHESRRGQSMSWHIKYPVENLEDLAKLRSVPFEVAPVSYEQYERQRKAVGDRGVVCLGLSSPWVVMAACMPFELALSWSITERNLVHELLEEITERFLAGLEIIFTRPLETVANIGGSEQCTPPMMSPEAYAEFVTPYESRLVAFLRKHGVAANCHCHGRVRHALPEMIKSGFESTDPVEPPDLGGDGDVTMAEAREIVGDRLTLCGNFQFDEMERSTPDQIRARVREILDTGRQRLIVAASAGPIARMTSRMIANYRAWIEGMLNVEY
jgi:uroporphyrinogen-III decarboxylase